MSGTYHVNKNMKSTFLKVFKLLNSDSSNLKIYQIIINSAKIFLGYIIYLVGGAFMFMLCERKNEVRKQKLLGKTYLSYSKLTQIIVSGSFKS